jgi:hypothetical protein
MPDRPTTLRFALAITCIDGRVQRPVVEYLRTRYGFDYVDLITEPGPEAALTDPARESLRTAIRKNIRFSLSAHHGELVALSAHDDCAGNHAESSARLGQLRAAAALVGGWEPDTRIVTLWVGANGAVREDPTSAG